MKEWIKAGKLTLNTLSCLEIYTEAPHTHAEGETHSDNEEKQYELTGYQIVLVQKVSNNETKLVNVRHILIEIPDLGTNATDADKAAAELEAQQKAEALLAQWAAGAATAESFAELATANSSDTGSVTTGGLYEDVYPGWAVDEFNDWCFAEGRQVGDTGIVKTDYGFHVMYFESFDALSYRDYLVGNDMLSIDLEQWLKDIKINTPYIEVNLSRMDWDIAMGSASGY